ncbi:MAG: PAS domain S-box protein [Calditrichaeota bacterium]|nr:PAS domain S-box protein [Calditrichota bacterium]
MAKIIIAEDTRIDAMERKLRASYQWLMTTLNNVGDAVIALDTEDRLTFMNPTAEALTGWHQGDAVGEKLSKILNVDVDASVRKSIQDYTRRKKSEGKVIRIRSNRVLITEDDSKLTIFDSRVPVGGGEGNLLGTVFILQDISARKKSEKELRQGIERFESLYDNVTLGVFRIAADGHVIMANQAMAEIFGFKTPRELSDYNILDDGIKPAFMSAEYSKQIKETGEIRNIESTLIRRDGSKIQIRESAQAISDSFGNIIYYEGTIEDITNWKKTEDDLRESEAHFRGILKNSKAGYFFTDNKGKIVDVNEAWLTLHKYDSLKEVKGKHYFTTMLEKDIEVARKQEAKLREGKSIPAGEARRLCRDGSIGYHTYTINPVKRANSIIGFEGFIIDTTAQKTMDKKRKSLEFRIQQLQKMDSLSILAGGIAHDFNNILQGILGNASLALMDLTWESPIRECVEQIDKSAQRAADLTRQMLAYSGKGRFVINAINLSMLIKDLRQLFEASIHKKAVLKFNLQDDLPIIEADVSQIRQVIMNLIINASEALNEEEGTITITTGLMHCDRNYLKETYIDEDLVDGDYAYVEVIDTGYGMDEDTIEKIFDPFFSTKFTGRGLGLAAVLGIVRGHKGALRVHSELGEGSTMRVLFPCALDTIPQYEVLDENVERWQSSGLILIVDDEPAVLRFVKRTLEKVGFTVLTAVDGRKAIEVFRKHESNIILVLLDLTMPHMNGEEANDKIREINSSVPVILTSGYSASTATNRFAGKGLAGFIQKPYRTTSLLQKIKNVLD